MTEALAAIIAEMTKAEVIAAVGTTIAAEGTRKAHVSGGMQRTAQEKAAKKADQRSKEQATTSIKIRQSQQRREGLAQEKPVIANPFASKSLKEKYTIGGGGSGSGTNY